MQALATIEPRVFYRELTDAENDQVSAWIAYWQELTGDSTGEARDVVYGVIWADGYPAAGRRFSR